MAITISGENNNDKILAQDGVIDQISGINIVGLITASHINVGSNIQLGNAGIITATTFVGNVTGNVNSTSPLLLQTGGSERFRITGNNELGIAGANYGSAGQVLTSGGSGSAVTWSTIPTQVTIANNADNRVITGGSGVNLNGEANLTYDGNTLFASGNITAASDGNRSTQGGVALVVRHSTNSAMRANHFIHDDFPTGSATYYIQATESGVTNDRNLALQGYGGKVKIGSGGVEPVETLDVSGNVKATSINLANTIFHTGDTDTLIEFTTDTIAFDTAGSERLRIDSSGRVLIGTSSLYNSNSYSNNLIIYENGDTGASIIGNNSNSNYASLYLSDTSTASRSFLEAQLGANGNFTIGTNGTGPIRFNNGSGEQARIKDGIVFVGTQNKINTSPTKFQVASNDATGSAIFARFNASVYSSYLDFYKSRSNTLGTAYVVNDDDHLGAFRFYGADGSNSGYTTAAEIYGSCDGGSGSSGDMPGRITFHTRPDGAGQSMQERLRIDKDGRLTLGDGNELASSYVTNFLVDGGSNSKLSLLGASDGTGTIAFPDGSSTGAQRMAGFIQMNHTSNDNGPRLNMGLNDTTLVHIRVPGSNRGQLEVYGNFNESDTPAIEINDSADARKVFLTNSSGDFNALTRNGSQTKGQLKMFESGVLIHNMKNPDATSTLQTFRTSTYKVTSGSTYTSLSPIQSYMQKGDPNNYGCFEEANCTLEVNGGGNDHYQPVGFVPRGYNLDTTSFGGQWAGEMWIHQTSSQNPESYGYSGYNNWATMSFKCRWDCAHWNAKPSGFWVEHYINYGRAQIGKIDASGTQSQFVIYLLPGSYKIRWNAVRGMSVHRPVSDGAALVMRDGGSFVTYSTLAYSSRNTSFDSEITPGSGTFAYCT